jgi:hypothetical protein
MLQDLPLTNYTWRQWVFWLIAGALGSGLTTAIITRWLYRRKLRADVAQADATTTEISIRTKVTEGDAIVRYIRELRDAQRSYDELRGELTGLQDQCANYINENRKLIDELAQANIDIELKELFIGRLHAATKLGMELKDLPPSLDDVILMLEVLRDAAHTTRAER